MKSANGPISRFYYGLRVASRAVSRELVNLATRVCRRVTYAPDDVESMY